MLLLTSYEFRSDFGPLKFFLFYSDYETLENGNKRKPWISLSGDDDGNHYIMYPKSEDKDNWEYDLQLIIETGTLHYGNFYKINIIYSPL
jgi:hypothetical protein